MQSNYINKEGGYSMSKHSIDFLTKMLEFLPDTYRKYKEEVEYNFDEVLETVIIEDVFMPKVIELLSKNENTKLLHDIFIYFEEVSNCEDEYLINIFSITVLEILGNDKVILKTAQEYMGPKTKQLQNEADRNLGRY
jgi:hypothetical protein